MGPFRILEYLALSDSLPRTSVMSNLTMGWWSVCMHINAFLLWRMSWKTGGIL